MRCRVGLGRVCVVGVLLISLLWTGPVAGEEKDDPIVAFVKSRVKDVDRPFTLIVGLQAKEGAGKKLEAAFAPAIKATRKEKGCLRYDLNRDTKTPARYLVYERWQSVGDLVAHLKTAHIKALLEALPDVADGEPQLQVLIPTGE